MQKHYANIVSWLSFCITITAMILISFNVLTINYIVIAVLLAAILDMFDGKIARKFLTKKEDFLFGEITDSLCDTINFGIVPIFTFLNIYNQENIIILIIISIFYIWTVVYRLARFSQRKDKLKVDYYEGIPVTIASPIAILMLIILKNSFNLGAILMLLLGFAMISNVKVKKL